jgi:hypothetical protein
MPGVRFGEQLHQSLRQAKLRHRCSRDSRAYPLERAFAIPEG